MRLQQYIDGLEQFAARRGISVQRTTLGPWVLGKVQGNHMILRTGLSKEQQLLTLIHELTHFLAHSESSLNRTVCEYEAEAVERLVAGQLGLRGGVPPPADLAAITDDMLAASVQRVRWVARMLFLETQAAVQV